MRQKHLIFSIISLVLLYSFTPSIASSQTVEELRTTMENAEDVLYNPSYGTYTYSYMWSYNRLEQMISDVRADIKALGGIQLSPSMHPAMQASDAIAKIGTAVHLTDEIRTQLINIETQREITEMLWVGNEDWYGVERAWVDYENAVNAYNEKVSVNKIVSPPAKQIVTELYFCYGPCDELFETAGYAQYSHQVYCSEKHGTSGTTGITFYICSSSGTCDRSNEHWSGCGGTCGEKFAPKKINRGQGSYSYVDNSPHYITCQAYYYRSFWESTVCGDKYYTCSGTCENGHSSSSSTENPVASPTPTPTPPPSPTYHACGEHETSVSGDHSLQASCTSTDSNGNICTVTSFYACDSHTHAYPSSEYCWCGGVDYVTCDGCGATYHLCTSAKGGCPSSADGYHYRAN